MMKKIIALSVPLKAFAAMLFSGMMILYMVSGTVYSMFIEEVFSFSIPFVFALQGMVLSMVISIMWGVFFSDVVIKKWRFFVRYLAFKLSLLPFLALCFYTFLAIPSQWVVPWFVALVTIMLFIFVIAALNEVVLRRAGKHYTEALKAYKAFN